MVRRVSVNERSSLYRREHHKEAMVWQERGRQPEPQDDDDDRQTDNELNQHTTVVSKPRAVDLVENLKLFTLVLECSSLFQVAAGGEPSRLEKLEAADMETVSSLGNGGTSVSLASSVPGELWSGGGRMEHSASYQLSPGPASGLGPGSADGEGADSMTREKSHHTLADLKRQRAAAKLNKYPAPPPPLPSPLEEEPSVSAAEVTPTWAQPELQATPRAEEEASLSQVYFTPASGDPPLLKLRAPEEDQPKNKEPCCGLM